MWTPQNRKRYDRSRLRYPSDLTDEEWAHVAPVIPPAKPGGNKRTVDVREVMNGVMYVLSTGCQWRALPKDLAPKSTVHDYLILWSCDGTLDRIHHALYVACREQAEREASPTAAIIDSQSVKGAEKGGPASIRMAMMRAKRSRARSANDALKKILPHLRTQIIKRSDQAKGFVVLPKRWIVERTLAWLNRCRRLTKDWENLNRTALAFLRLASIRLMLRKLCNPH